MNLLAVDAFTSFLLPDVANEAREGVDTRLLICLECSRDGFVRDLRRENKPNLFRVEPFQRRHRGRRSLVRNSGDRSAVVRNQDLNRLIGMSERAEQKQDE